MTTTSSPQARAALDLITGGLLCAAPSDLSLLHFLFLVASTGGADRFGAISAAERAVAEVLG